MTRFEISSEASIVPITVHHANALASLVRENIDHLRQYLPAVAELASFEAAMEHLYSVSERSKKGEMLEWHIFAGTTLCGSVRVKDIDRDDRKAKIGYFIGEKFQGKGLVTRSVRAVLEYCFDTLGINRMELRCAAGNLPSMRVAERLGFTHEGVLRQEEFLNGIFVDQHVYALLSDDFLMPARLTESASASLELAATMP